MLFLSTPSGWRATAPYVADKLYEINFYPRPPGGGRRLAAHFASQIWSISIHALRVEGDLAAYLAMNSNQIISIHALRVEGDVNTRCFHLVKVNYFYPRPPGGGRHIRRAVSFGVKRFLSTPSGWRATRLDARGVFGRHFYPRPPGGGRQQRQGRTGRGVPFLSTPSGWRATYTCPLLMCNHTISIHALRVEGDRFSRRFVVTLLEFLSTPSGWRATAKTDKVFVCFCAKGRRICLFKTRKEKICRWCFKKDKFWVLIWCEGSGKSVCALASHCG